MDFFTVPTITLGVLYCFFVIGHDRRKILRLNVTRNPNALWIVQQMREAWPYAPAQRFLLFDHDSRSPARKAWEPSRCALPFVVHGRTVLPNAGSGVADEICWTK
jgi:hypothetical protein